MLRNDDDEEDDEEEWKPCSLYCLFEKDIPGRTR